LVIGWKVDRRWWAQWPGPRIVQVPLDGGEIVRLVSGTAVNPVWSPDGALIVYTGPNVGADAPLLAVRPDGTQVEFPAINVRRDGRRARFLPNGQGLVYMQGALASQNFWLLDLDSQRRRPLTHLTDPSAMFTFDVAPDGKSIVFDRVRENSDIVLIDLRH
jgi:Tol biopolymer transport system component